MQLIIKRLKLALRFSFTLTSSVLLLSACGGEQITTTGVLPGGMTPVPLPVSNVASTPVPSPTPSPVLSPIASPTVESVVQEPVPREPCVSPEGLALTDINSVTEWINALPKPVTLPCVVESLPRPLNIQFTQSVFSAQPSLGRGNPRVFIFYDKLILSVVTAHGFNPLTTPESEQLDALEVGYITQDIVPRSDLDTAPYAIKGEYKLPYNEAIALKTPYDDVLSGSSGTFCGTCHTAEQQVDVIDGTPVFASHIYQPVEELAVSILQMQNERTLCDETREPFRCAMLSAIFDHGILYPVAFPENAEFFR